MHYVSAEGIAKSYGIKPLFSNLSFHLSQGDKVGLIARNGSGKSTLLKILAGKETTEEGKVWIHKDVQVVYLEQEPVFLEDRTVLENLFSHTHPILDTIKAYEALMETPEAPELGAVISRMDELDAWGFEATVKQILGKLNLHHLQQPLKNLSGGQRKRTALARTLIDVGLFPGKAFLILDEPTNHLDVEMVEWLEKYLSQEKLTLLLVTHDRYFLDAVCQEIWELDEGKLFTYRGNYEDYLEKKAARLESETASIEKARNTFRKELEWMRKQPKARTTKSKSRQDRFYDVEARASQKIENAQVQLQVKMNRLGGKILELKKVYKNFGDRIILKGFDYTFKKGERLGIVGANGVGKSTFINILQGLEAPDSGKINVGETVVFGYYSQAGLPVKEDMRVIEWVKGLAESFPLAKGGSMSASQFLQRFLFNPEQQYTYISKLSGGEKRRLHLLGILFRNPNFLILDEPTNDLDLPTLAVLEEFLFEFEGCLLLVSHDRYFMDRLVDHLLVMEGHGQIRDFPGNFSQYRMESVQTGRSGAGNEAAEINILNVPVESIGKSKIQWSYKEKREFEILEKEIQDLNAEKNSIHQLFEKGELPLEQLNVLSARISAVSELLDQKEMRWLELSELRS